MSTIDPLAAFIGARLAEDEREIRNDPPVGMDDAMLPARMLREVEAKRAILAEHCTYATRCRATHPGWVLSDSSAGWRACMGCGLDPDEYQRTPDIDDCPTLRALAVIWADHPDCRAEWSADPATPEGASS